MVPREPLWHSGQLSAPRGAQRIYAKWLSRLCGAQLALDDSTRLAFEHTRHSYENTMMPWIRTATSPITFGFGHLQVLSDRRAQREATKLLHRATRVRDRVCSISTLLGYTSPAYSQTASSSAASAQGETPASCGGDHCATERYGAERHLDRI